MSGVRMERIFRAAPIGMGVVSKRILLDVNQRLCEITGYSSNELIGNSSRMLYANDQDYERVGVEKYRQIAQRGTGSAETRFKCKDGKLIEVLLSSTPVDPSELSAGITFTVLDITGRKQTEEALRQSEEKYKALYESAPLPYQSLDDAGCFKDVNPAWLETLGYDLGDVIGHWFGDFLDPESKRLFGKRFPEFKRLGCVHDVQFKIRHKQGHYLHITYEGCIGYTPEGKFNQTYCVFQDITQRRQMELALQASEAHLRTLIETLPDLVWLKDPDGVYLSCNPKFERFFGAKQAEIVGKTDYDFVDRKLADFFREKDKAAMTAGKPCMNEEEVVYAVGGNTEILETIKTPMFDAEGRLVGILGIAREITSRKKAEAERRAQLDELHRWQNAMQGREGRVLELKQEINSLLREQGKPPRYSSVEDDDGSGDDH